jgi:hypothetical protein
VNHGEATEEKSGMERQGRTQIKNHMRRKNFEHEKNFLLELRQFHYHINKPTQKIVHWIIANYQSGYASVFSVLTIYA